MASPLSLQLHKPVYSTAYVGLRRKRMTAVGATGLRISNEVELGNPLLSKKNASFANYGSPLFVPSRAVTPSCTSYEVQAENEAGLVTAEADTEKLEFNRVNCLEWVLHESAQSFSHAVGSLGLVRTGAELAMAWNGKDVHQWHKRMAYQVAVYALLRTAVEVEILLSQDRYSNSSLAADILTPKINLLGTHIERQLKMTHPELFVWFKEIELPRISGFFIPLLKKWSMEYAGSGVAGIIVAISCYAAVEKLGCQRIQCNVFTSTMKNVLKELMDLSYSLVEVEKLYKLATEAGFEHEFLSHFGGKILPRDFEELEFWIGLAHRKLSAEIWKENVIEAADISHETANNLATLGLFAYLARKTRSYLSIVNIKDLDESVKDFLSYMECGCIFIYPELACASVYESFMDVVVDEVGWLEFYPKSVIRRRRHGERRRKKRYPIQAEREMLFSSIFTACYDVFSGFAHFARSNQQPLNAELLAFLLQSQCLLTSCMEVYRAVYDRSRSEPEEKGSFDHVTNSGKKSSKMHLKSLEKLSVVGPDTMAHQVIKASSLDVTETTNVKKEASPVTTKPSSLCNNFLERYMMKFASTTSDIWTGTQLLFLDIMVSVDLLGKQLRGHKITKRERRRLQRMLNDIANLIPVTILMIIPVSAVGHAAILAGLNKYMPYMIPSPFCAERLDVVKQLKRTKKLEVQSWGNLEGSCSQVKI